MEAKSINEIECADRKRAVTIIEEQRKPIRCHPRDIESYWPRFTMEPIHVLLALSTCILVLGNWGIAVDDR